MISRRGNLRVPGADLHRLPTRVDLSGVSVMEGLRTTIAAGVSLLPVNWVASDVLLVMGVGALVVCFSDTGGPTRQRIPPMLVLTVLGALAWGLFGMLRGLGLVYVVPAAILCVFANALARVWGVAGTSIGNVLTVIIALALDLPLTGTQALRFGGAFVAGGAWACLLTVLLLGSDRYRPVTRSVNEVWALLIDLTRDLSALARNQAGGGRNSDSEWHAHAHVHRRAVRESIERARAASAGTFRRPGPSSSRAMANLLRLEVAERIFGALIVTSDLIEHDPNPDTQQQAARLLRRLQRLLPKVGGADPVTDVNRVARAIARIGAASGGPPALRAVSATIAEWSLAALRLKQDAKAASFRSVISPLPVEQGSFWEPLRANLSWNSAILRHAVRVTVVTVPAMTVALVFWNPYSHWLSYSVALTMQPFFSASWQRVLERGGGTVVGALIGGGLAFLPQTPLVHAALLLPLSILGFSARQVSYGAFIACMTPLVVLLFDIAEPGHSEWTIAMMRIAYTIAGGALTMAASFLLWPSWEPQRLRVEFHATMGAYAALAGRTAMRLAGQASEQDLAEARRAAGVATNNFEASLSRALQEPRRGRGPALRTALLADAAFRRLGALLMTLERTASLGNETERQGWRDWSGWLEQALNATGPATPPAAPGTTDFARDVGLRVQAHLTLLHEAGASLDRVG
ncbi:MAG TPA: FUSC family protein [Rhodopila sp.]|uniref:FUSC family protein n=1 Tax=Rhodopila sp. TaxID=2480087 RepID=UPI002BD8127E|nr:FUSC family protein [Rhodopila sp.]HVY16251.1 FUSC family protein [Rhodopila sp.]